MTMPAFARWTLFAAMALGAATQAAAADEKLLAAARTVQPAVIDSLRERVIIESGSQDAAGLKAMVDYVEGRLRALGAVTERIPAGVGPGEMVKGTFAGTGQRHFMLIAHLDKAYGEGILATEPYRQDGNKLYGPGIADDKGGIAVILHSLAILRDAGWKDYARLTVLINPDEEIGSVGSGELIATLGDAHDVVLSYEPTAAKAVAKYEGVLLMAAGTAQARLAVKGVAAHAGAAPDQGRKLMLHSSSGGGTVAGYAGRSGKAAVLESLGLAGWGYHAKNEYIEIDSIVPRLYLTTRLLSDLDAGR